jgi:ribose 5-phosphate isomerase B
MKIALAADHAGFRLKESVREQLHQSGHDVIDLGAHSEESTDYPDYARAVGERVSKGEVDRGVLVCSTGVGMSIAANKVPGVRAALAANVESVRLTRSHNDANVLSIGAKFTSEQEAGAYLEAFLKTEFEGGRHARRVAKIADIERAATEEQVTKA